MWSQIKCRRGVVSELVHTKGVWYPIHVMVSLSVLHCVSCPPPYPPPSCMYPPPYPPPSHNYVFTTLSSTFTYVSTTLSSTFMYVSTPPYPPPSCVYPLPLFRLCRGAFEVPHTGLWPVGQCGHHSKSQLLEM